MNRAACSDDELRQKVLVILEAGGGSASASSLTQYLADISAARIKVVIDDMVRDGLIALATDARKSRHGKPKQRMRLVNSTNAIINRLRTSQFFTEARPMAKLEGMHAR